MPEITLVAEAGRPTGSRASNRLRRAGRIPGVIYGHGIEPVPISVAGRDLRAALTTESGMNALLSVRVDGQDHLTLAREVQRHPVRNTVVHVDFQIVRRDEVVSADVPLVLAGEAHEVDAGGGVVEQPLTSLTIRATPAAIPAGIEVDITALSMGDTIRVGDLTLPDGVATEVDADEPVVIARAGVALEEAAPAEEAEAEAEGGGPAATPSRERPTPEGAQAGEGASPSTGAEEG
jgi:large subunit ribosomal protein L25